MSPAESLLHRMLAAARTGYVTPEQGREFNAEAATLGPEAMVAAQQQVGDEREAKRGHCTVCHACEPVAAYGGWCCAKRLEAANG